MAKSVAPVTNLWNAYAGSRTLVRYSRFIVVNHRMILQLGKTSPVAERFTKASVAVDAGLQWVIQRRVFRQRGA